MLAESEDHRLLEIELVFWKAKSCLLDLALTSTSKVLNAVDGKNRELLITNDITLQSITKNKLQ